MAVNMADTESGHFSKPGQSSNDRFWAINDFKPTTEGDKYERKHISSSNEGKLSQPIDEHVRTSLCSAQYG